ncbi:hypothetical protein DVK05_03140 [Halorubrum sp. Atlit-8R]|uniref:hypothetical protein n=1 Tax=unclassified Halorubrum TaxID=2642239 RepID=UPI000EF25EE2|nr:MULTISPECIES: hypothetical protein [unclassified Halorubrum]RLM71049.1 hypothetical protein DVK08_02620 [Halorubrum sp. Atlit-9R]RLM71917.1 hypothetical protein DVK08_07365 [Halorubrum sp. Atlit-9R]RLM82798.1 hypothetical protein DVK05_03140 [Halorubrum sp. Atlit-8R]
MDRRALLSALGGSAVALSGCVGETGTGPATNGTDGTDGGRSGDDGDSTGSLDVELRTVPHVVTAYEPAPTRGIDPDHVVPESEIPDALRDPLAAARDGRFETDDPSDALLAAVDEFRVYDRGELRPYVEIDGTRYAFHPSLPTFTAELADATAEGYDEGRVLREAGRRDDLGAAAVETFVNALTAYGPNAARGEYRRCVRPEPVDDFLDEYDYLEDGRGVSRIRTAVEHEAPPYAITARELTDGDMWDRPVVDESALDPEVVTFFERALASEHRAPALPTPDRSQLFADDVPDAYAALAAEHDEPVYYRINGTVYSVIVGESLYDRVPVSVAVAAAKDAPREFALTVAPAPENAAGEAEGPYTFTSRGALPSALWTFHDGERRSLEIVETEGVEGPRPSRSDGQALESLDAGEEMVATYAVPADLPAGTYVSRGLFNVSWNVPGQTPSEHGAYPFELAIGVA